MSYYYFYQPRMQKLPKNMHERMAVYEVRKFIDHEKGIYFDSSID